MTAVKASNTRLIVWLSIQLRPDCHFATVSTAHNGTSACEETLSS